jgi:hypothetical protein
MNPDSSHFQRLHKCLAELVLMVMAYGLAQRGYAQQTDASVPTGRSESNRKALILAGTVVNSITGEPIRRAAVAISGQAGGVTLTDNSGNLNLEDWRFPRFASASITLIMILPSPGTRV